MTRRILPRASWLARRRSRGVLVAMLAAMAMWQGPGAPAAAVDVAAGRYAFSDHDRNSSFAVTVDPTSSANGAFTFGAAGVGLIWSDTPASVEIKSDKSVILRYTGPGRVDRQATLDPLFGLDLVGSTGEPAQVRLEAQINPDRVTSATKLWLDDVPYELIDRSPAADPRIELDSILAALRTQDWLDLYARSFVGFREVMTESDFVADMTAAWATKGTVTAAGVTTGPTLTGRRTGIDAAVATVTIALSTDGVSTAHVADVTMILEAQGWRWVNIELRP
jgi:hypothetical protein